MCMALGNRRTTAEAAPQCTREGKEGVESHGGYVHTENGVVIVTKIF